MLPSAETPTVAMEGCLVLEKEALVTREGAGTACTTHSPQRANYFHARYCGLNLVATL